MRQHFEQARELMVETQVRPNRVTDEALISAMLHIPRENFVAEPFKGQAYTDEDVSLGNGRYLLEPMILARLLQAAHIQKTDMALDIGCGTGYATALLARLCSRVTGIESDAKLAKTAGELLMQSGISNATIVQQDMRKGYAPKAPYNVILINGAAGAVPEALKSQLAEGGRLVTVLSRHGHIGTAIHITRHGNSFVTQNLFEAATPFLAGFEAAKPFVL